MGYFEAITIKKKLWMQDKWSLNLCRAGNPVPPYGSRSTMSGIFHQRKRIRQYGNESAAVDSVSFHQIVYMVGSGTDFFLECRIQPELLLNLYPDSHPCFPLRIQSLYFLPPLFFDPAKKDLADDIIWLEQNKEQSVILILDGNSGIGAHVRSKLCIWSV